MNTLNLLDYKFPTHCYHQLHKNRPKSSFVLCHLPCLFHYMRGRMGHNCACVAKHLANREGIFLASRRSCKTCSGAAARRAVEQLQDRQWSSRKTGSGAAARRAVEQQQDAQWSSSRTGSGAAERLTVEQQQGWQWSSSKTGGGAAAKLAVEHVEVMAFLWSFRANPTR